MSKLNFNVLMQILGMSGVIGSLIFVGLELQQSQRIALADQQQARTEIGISIVTNLNTIGVDMQSVYFENSLNYDLTVQEVGLRNMAQATWFMYENDFYQYSQGLMDAYTWAAKKRGINLLYNNCVVRRIYNSRAPVFSKEFRKVVEPLEDICAKA